MEDQKPSPPEFHDHVLGIPVEPVTHSSDRKRNRTMLDPGVPETPNSAILNTNPYLHHPLANGFPQSRQTKIERTIEGFNQCYRSTDSLVHGISEHVKMGENISDIVKDKLSLGAAIIAEGGVERVFRSSFKVGDEEKLIKTSPCYLSTTTGPVSGLLFISNEKVYFCSDRPLTFTVPAGGLLSSHYKVVIPLGRIMGANQGENVKRPKEKYIEIVTVDNHEFWFMGFVNYAKAFEYLSQVISKYSKRPHANF
ncbi:GEM-like protein 7 isoform X2 [Amborella trichopoda]|uniref:GEM-like protein 7 isoform X2 n=1 Tax=Amborella trichopoda TaxID=13333 RepID=UPI0005D45DBD|nr:GEM-like protein 7 isoform X2 [Amborella trichopoda]|eukprot:XP_011624613.1 GEM-like protein 7 isoform X2 [Amborella trichopoda]